VSGRLHEPVALSVRGERRLLEVAELDETGEGPGEGASILLAVEAPPVTPLDEHRDAPGERPRRFAP